MTPEAVRTIKPTQTQDWHTKCRAHPEAFAEVYDATFPFIFKYILYRVANVTDAEDLTGQVFLKAYRAIHRFQFRNKPIEAWLYGIARNEIADFLRKNRQPALALSQEAQDLPDPHPDVEEELQAAESHLLQHQHFLQIHQCLQDLKPIDQDLIVLRFFQDKSYDEMSRLLGKRSGTLMTRMSRALTRLKHSMEKRGYNHETFGETAHASAQA